MTAKNLRGLSSFQIFLLAAQRTTPSRSHRDVRPSNQRGTRLDPSQEPAQASANTRAWMKGLVLGFKAEYCHAFSTGSRAACSSACVGPLPPSAASNGA